MNKQIVIISRQWHKPRISMIVTDEEVSFAIDLTDFRDAVKKELGIAENGTGTRVDVAFDRVVSGIKNESSRIMG